ncbi:hypothetical protein PX699_13400 [Sphingobium sp. H39-3-25]|uniref:hypothetical protein n=1 Tax=Sphingobium arseniciresistens TaxID=3030834 RepID=UPI0023B93CC0|nr:hypothetical protein [Sphingobium arseniciresistens]
MKPVELFDLCMDAIDSFNRGEMVTDKPKVMLALLRPVCPRGRTIRLFGRTGPSGEIAIVKSRDDGQFDVVAYFQAVSIVQALGEEFGVKVKVRRA